MPASVVPVTGLIHGPEELDLFDTNVLVAATMSNHLHHKASNARLAQLANGRGACAAHTLAETYTTLTRTSRYGIPPSDAARIVDQASKTFKIVSLTPAEYVPTIEAAALLGLAGPIIYDALLMACARKIRAGSICTHNVKHFRLVAPDLASLIVEP
jgi:predicted nucleic acid-binding protein